MENRKLRLNPLGRDDKGRCYWLHRDHRANIRLYREDQDDETWKLIARYIDYTARMLFITRSYIHLHMYVFTIM